MSRQSVITLASAAAVIAVGFSFGTCARSIVAPVDAPELDVTGFDPAVIDLGEQLWGTALPFKLAFHNAESEPVTIESIGSSCGCTIVSQKGAEGQRIVNPGESATIFGTLSTPRDIGSRNSVVTLTSSSGTKYQANVKVSVKGTWSLRPTVLDFGEILLDGPSADEPLSNVIVFESKIDSLLGVKVSVPWLDYRTARDGTDATKILVRVLPQRIPPGLNTAKVVVSTDNELKPAGTIFVRVRGSHQLSAIPENVFLVGNEISRVRFVDREGRPVRIATAKSASDKVVIVVTPSGDLEIRSRTAGAVAGRITVNVHTTDGLTGSCFVSIFQ